jgi:hypothetical protein
MNWLPEFDEFFLLLGMESPKTTIKKLIGKENLGSHHTFTSFWNGNGSPKINKRYFELLIPKLKSEWLKSKLEPYDPSATPWTVNPFSYTKTPIFYLAPA